jgi:hypothetical protein
MQFRVSGAFLVPDRKLKLRAGYGIPPAPEVSVLSQPGSLVSFLNSLRGIDSKTYHNSKGGPPS